MTDSPFFIKHNGKLDPIVSRDIDLKNNTIPKWSDDELHLSNTNMSQTADGVLINDKLTVIKDAAVKGALALGKDDTLIEDTNAMLWSLEKRSAEPLTSEQLENVLNTIDTRLKTDEGSSDDEETDEDESTEEDND